MKSVSVYRFTGLQVSVTFRVQPSISRTSTWRTQRKKAEPPLMIHRSMERHHHAGKTHQTTWWASTIRKIQLKRECFCTSQETGISLIPSFPQSRWFGHFELVQHKDLTCRSQTDTTSPKNKQKRHVMNRNSQFIGHNICIITSFTCVPA